MKDLEPILDIVLTILLIYNSLHIIHFFLSFVVIRKYAQRYLEHFAVLICEKENIPVFVSQSLVSDGVECAGLIRTVKGGGKLFPKIYLKAPIDKDSCYTLLHEIGHYLLQRKGKFEHNETEANLEALCLIGDCIPDWVYDALQIEINCYYNDGKGKTDFPSGRVYIPFIKYLLNKNKEIPIEKSICNYSQSVEWRDSA